MNKPQAQIISEKISEQRALGRDIRTMVVIASLFEHEGKQYGLAVPVLNYELSTEAERNAPIGDCPTVYLTLDDVETTARMLRDLAWSGREVLRQLEAGEPLLNSAVRFISKGDPAPVAPV